MQKALEPLPKEHYKIEGYLGGQLSAEQAKLVAKRISLKFQCLEKYLESYKTFHKQMGGAPLLSLPQSTL